MLTPNNSALHTLRQRSTRRLLEGTHGLTDAARRVLTELKAPKLLSRKRMYLAIVEAPWDARTRNFAWNMAAGVMPCGKGIKGSDTSLCPVCAAQTQPPLDSVAHFAHCPCLQALREWFASVWAQMGWCGTPDFAHFMICGHSPPCGDHVAATAVRGALIGTAHTVRNAIILDGAASAPPPIVVRRTASHLMRHAILLDFQCAFASDSGGAKPSKWRPATAAAFAKRWEKLCTRANGRPRFHGLIETPRDTSP